MEETVIVAYNHMLDIELEAAREAIRTEINAQPAPDADTLAQLLLHLDAIRLEIKRRWVGRYGWWCVGGIAVVGGAIWWARSSR